MLVQKKVNAVLFLVVIHINSYKLTDLKTQSDFSTRHANNKGHIAILNLRILLILAFET